MVHTQTRSFGRDVAVATAAVVGLHALARGFQFPPIQVPGYLLVVGFDVLEGAFGPAGGNYEVLFAGYLVGVGVVGGTIAHYGRRWAADAESPSWRVGLAGGLAVVGVGALAFAAAVAVRLSEPTPALVTGTTGLVLLGLAGWLLDVDDGIRARLGG